ncbi:hypothetical protein C7B80_16745 [Cyanosarcina cf. burmensis CCALA 770]|nr:hypothetical protein C7B80_16745 [Cyanosarcina cf. burmensis CCALA 770]
MTSRIHEELVKFAVETRNNITKYFIKVVNPKWLQKIDQNLLLNRPKFWSLKLHYVVYYALAGNLLIAFFVDIFPISSPSQLPNLLITGLVIIPIGETILLFYWLYIQFLLNGEKRYGYIRKRNGLLELFSYSVCLILITSGLIFFLVVTPFKAETVISRTQLAIDLITLDAIQRGGLEDSENYPKYLINSVTSEKLSKLQTESIFSEKYNNREKRHSRKKELEKMLQDAPNKKLMPYKQLCFLSDDNDNLRKYWQKNISLETRVFVEYNDHIYFRDYKCNWLKELSNKGDAELIEKSGFNQLVQKIRNNQLKEVISPMLKYVPPGNIVDIPQLITLIKTDKYMLQVYPRIKSPEMLAATVVQRSARNLYQTFYTPTIFQVTLIWNYLLLNLISLLLLLFYSTYMVDFIFTLVPIFLTIAALLFVLTFLSSSFPLVAIILFFIFLSTIIVFVSCLALSRRKIKKYWRFKVLNLVALPFAVVVSAVFFIEIMHSNEIFPMNNEEVYNSSLLLALLAYIPFVPFLKNELLRQLNLPKD